MVWSFQNSFVIFVILFLYFSQEEKGKFPTVDGLRADVVLFRDFYPLKGMFISYYKGC